MNSPPIRLAHSPDSDDAFMFFGLAEGRVDTEGLTFIHELSDIETLNRRAERGELAVTAVSFHAYAYLSGRYLLLPHGASFGDGYGPVVVGRRDRGASNPADLVVASPGPRTSAQLALELWAPGIRTEFLSFDRILEAVRQGRYEAGLLIHEGQLTFRDEGLTEIVDLGRWWKARTALPLPLGGNVVRRDLGPETISRVSRVLLRSIEYGLEHRGEALDYAMRFARNLDRARADRFVQMYVNQWTRGYGPRGREAIERFLGDAHEAGLVPKVEVEFAPGDPMTADSEPS